MHVAICVFGLLRSTRHTIGSFQNRIIKPIIDAGYTYDVLLHTYSFNGTLNFIRNNEVIDSKLVDFSDWKLYEPSYYFIEDQDKFDMTINMSEYSSHGDYWSNDGVSLRNHIRALHSLQHLANIVAETNDISYRSKPLGYGKKFDYVIYARPDVYFTNDLPVQLMQLYPDKLLLPDFHRSCKGKEYNDRFAMGNTDIALIYGNRMDYLLNYSIHKIVKSETFLYDYLRQFNASVLEIPLRFQRIRFSGLIHSRDVSLMTLYEQQSVSHNSVPSFLRFLIRNSADSHNIYCSPNAKLTILDLHRCTTYFTTNNISTTYAPTSALDLLYQANISYKQRVENSNLYNQKLSCHHLRGNDDFYYNVCNK